MLPWRKILMFALCVLIPCCCYELLMGERDFSCPGLVKTQLVDEVSRYIDEASGGKSMLTATHLVDQCLEYDVDICFVLAQAHVESHFGTEGLARRTHSVFNVGAGDGCSYDTLNERYLYTHPDSSVVPYLELLTTRYLVNDKTEKDLMKCFATPGGKRYASNVDYEKKLRRRYDVLVKSTKIKELQERVTCNAPAPSR